MMNHGAKETVAEPFVRLRVEDERVPHLVDENLGWENVDSLATPEPEKHEHVAKEHVGFATPQTVAFEKLVDDEMVPISEHASQ